MIIGERVLIAGDKVRHKRLNKNYIFKEYDNEDLNLAIVLEIKDGEELVKKFNIVFLQKI